MIHTRNLIPKYLSENSKDIHIFLRLIDLVVNNAKLKSDDFINILNPDKCPNALLPLLSSYLGYDYDYGETSDRNRVIIRAYKNMIKNKGNVVGVQIAISTAISMLISKSIINMQNLYDVAYYDKYYNCTNCNYISYSEFDICPHCGAENTAKENDIGSIVATIEYPIYSAKSYDLIEAVRPAGTNLLLYSGTIENQVENLGISDFIKLQTTYLNAGTSEVGGKDSVSGFTVLLKESPVNFYYCESCGKLFEGATDTQSCPYCGSSDYKLENHSSIRYLYRLYNSTKQYDNTVENLIKSISDDNVVNSDNCVGIILRLHIDHTGTTESKWDLSDFTQSFIFGLKPYVKLDDGTECFEYTVEDILNRIVSVNKTVLSTLQNKQKSGYTYQLLKQYANYSIKSVNEDDPVSISSESELDVDKLKEKLQSKQPKGDKNVLYKVYYKYDDSEETYFVYFIYGDSGYTYVADDSGDLFVIKVTDTNAGVTTDGTEVVSYYNYQLVTNNIVLTDYNGTSTTYDVSSTNKLKFKLSSSSEENSTVIDGNRLDTETNTLTAKDGVKDTEVNTVNYALTVGESNQNDTIVNNVNYIRVCGSCGKVLPDNADVCPYCGGVKDYVYTSSSGAETVTQSIDPSILCGNYILDLYFN